MKLEKFLTLIKLKSEQEPNQRRNTELLREKYNTFVKLERESIDDSNKRINYKKSFKEIHQNINYVFDNFEKFIKLSKKIKRSKYEKIEKANTKTNSEKNSNQ